MRAGSGFPTGRSGDPAPGDLARLSRAGNHPRTVGDQYYQLNPELPAGLFAFPEIGGLRQPGGQTVWAQPLEEAIAGVAQPVNRQDMESLRAEIERIAGAAHLRTSPRRLAIGSVSDLVRVNRVQGLTLGFGGTIGLAENRCRCSPTWRTALPTSGYFPAITIGWSPGPNRLSLSASQRISDFSDLPVIAPLQNSLTAQEAGNDHGDYVLLNSVALALRHRLGTRTWVTGELGITESHPAPPAPGQRQLQGESPWVRATIELPGWKWSEAVPGSPCLMTCRLESPPSRGWLSPVSQGAGFGPVAGSSWGERVAFPVVSRRRDRRIAGLPKLRTGGRGTLLGEPFRAFGGREMVLGHLEWRFDLPAPAISLGTFASTGRVVTLAPFVAAGYAARPYSSLPWDTSDGVRPVAGVALELFMRLIRVEAGIGLRDGKAGLTVDISRDWWGLL